MKVILISRVAKLGVVGDIINVKDGYGKNFLIPEKKAIFYSVSNYKVYEEKKQYFEAENKVHFDAAKDNKGKLDGKNIIIIENASDDGRLYGSITTATIANKINDIIGEKTVSRVDISLKSPIKDLGVFDVKVDLYSDVIAQINVVVSRSESESEIMIAKSKEDKKSEKTTKSFSAEEKDQQDQLSAALGA
ncbi:MAG: large subunit ribosomal protein L9 [Rickettsiales bacterium]|jgi:large subunit ribosomal protein L9